MDYRKYRGVIFGFPEKENTEFNLEFARFIEVHTEGASHVIDEELETLRSSIQDKRFFSYTGDLSEIFELFLESNTFNDALHAQGLTYTSGENDSFSNDSEDTAESLLWSNEIKQLLAHVKDNYFICSDQFLLDEGFCEMYERYEKEYSALIDDPSTSNLTIEEELEKVETIKYRVENEVLAERK